MFLVGAEINFSLQSEIAACAVAPPKTSPKLTVPKHASFHSLSEPIPSGLIKILLKLASFGPDKILW